MATVFQVYGPLKVPCYQGAGGCTITPENIVAFWEENDDFAKDRGCYVFGMKAGKGYTPAYIGKATRNFKQGYSLRTSLLNISNFWLTIERALHSFFS